MTGGEKPCLTVSKITQLGEHSTEDQNDLALLAKAHPATRWAPPIDCNLNQKKRTPPPPPCLFTELSSGPVASRSTRCFIWFRTGALSPWASPSLGLCRSLEGAWLLGWGVGAAVRRNKAPPTQAMVSVSPSLKHHYANESGTPAHLLLLILTLHPKVEEGMCRGGSICIIFTFKCPGAIGSRFSFQKGNHEYKVEN